MPDDLFHDDTPRNSTRSDGAGAAGAGADSAAADSAAADGAAAGEVAGLDADRAVTVIYGTQYRSLVRLAALLIGEVNAAEDVVQESFVDMHGAWSRLRDTGSAVSFLRQAVVSRSRSILPHPAPPPSASPPSASAPPARPGPAAAAEGAAIRAIRALPVAQREALVLRLYLDLPEQQIATAMGISRDAVRDHATSGMAALRALL